MLRTYRHRRGPYALARPSVVPSIVRLAVFSIAVLLLLWMISRWILGFFGGFSSLQRTRVDLQVEGRGAVSTSIEGGLLQRAEGASKLYAGDKVVTGTNGRARLSFTDGMTVRMKDQSEVTISQSGRSDDVSASEVVLVRGAIWLESPASQSGELLRRVTVSGIAMDFPASTRALVDEEELRVFAADGMGVTVTSQKKEYQVGEGQKFVFTGADGAGDLSTLRHALDPADWNDIFARENLGRAADTPSAPTELLAVSAPADRAALGTDTVTVRGTYGDGVTAVRVNGRLASLNATTRSFSLDVTLEPSPASTEVSVEALDAEGTVVATARRTVSRENVEVAAPTIKLPAVGGGTYTTTETEILITGEAPAGTAGIMVNEYRLQLYKPGNRTWSYLAKTDLKNMKFGENIYDVIALDDTGRKSAAIRLTINLEQLGMPSSAATSQGQTTSAATSDADETALPTNDPLQPGTLKITGPTPGTAHTQTGTELLLEGTTPAETASVWVNGYKLQLYKPGRRTWNYLAKTTLGNLRRGSNVYRVIARDEENKILDEVEYTVTFRP